MRPRLAPFFSIALAALMAQSAQANPTLDSVKAKGYLTCGVHHGLPGFSSPDDKGNWTGIDVDVCRAVAAAVFGDANKVKFTPLSAKERLTALQSGEVDVLSRNTTWTLTRDAALGLNFTGVTYYDGQGFLIRKDMGISSARELGGASVCVQTGTTTELNLGDYFRANGMEYTPVVFEKSDETLAAYQTGRCDALTSDRSQLYAHRIKLRAPTEHVVLPEVISKEPLGPAVRQGDDAWFNIVRWSLFAMINAEEMGVDSTNAQALKTKSRSPAVRRLLGVEGDKGKALRLANSWVYDIITQVGNYSEMFERNLGANSPLQIERGLNQLWTQGGLQYAPPIR